jgi:hypothetical protein
MMARSIVVKCSSAAIYDYVNGSTLRAARRRDTRHDSCPLKALGIGYKLDLVHFVFR